MTEPLTVTVLDPQTMDELQPPCEAKWDWGPCGNPAEWVVHIACPMCGPRTVLSCDVDKRGTAQGRLACSRCRTPRSEYFIRMVSAEPLR